MEILNFHINVIIELKDILFIGGGIDKMREIKILIKVQLLTFFGINKAIKTRDEKRLKRLIFMGIGLIMGNLLLLMISFLFSLGLAFTFRKVDKMDLLPAITMAIASIIALFTTIYKANGILYAFNDYDSIMSMPVKIKKIIYSRMILLYLMNIAFTLITVIPSAIVYVVIQKPDIGFYLMYLITLFAIPIVPIVIACVIGAIITRISIGFKYYNIINIVLTIIFALGLLFMSSYISSLSINVADVGESVTQAVYSTYPLTELYINAVYNQDLLSLFLFVGISIGLFVLFANIISLKYKEFNTELTTNLSNGDYKAKKLKKSSQFIALYKKEIRRFFSSSQYVINTGIGGVLLIVFSIMLGSYGIIELENLLEVYGLTIGIREILPLLGSILVGMTCTTACSISLEGKNLWILKISPLKVSKIFLSKIVVNLTILIPAIIISSTILAYVLDVSLELKIMLFITPIIYSFFTSVLGMVVNLRFPSLEWTNEVTVIKKSISTTISMVSGFLSASIPVIFVLTTRDTLKIQVLSICVAMIGIITIGLYIYLLKKGEELFKKL